ncbi:MAG: flippase [Thermodesulfobacteriota bacterium]
MPLRSLKAVLMSHVVDSSLRNTLQGAALVLLGVLFGGALSFAAKILIARNTTQAEFGIYTLLVALVAIYSHVANAGLQEGTPRFISIFQGEGRHTDAGGVAKASFLLGALFSVSSWPLLFLLADFISVHIFHKPQLAGPLRIISFSIPFLVLAQNAAGILRGYKIIAPKVYFLDAGMPLCLLLSLCAGFLFSFGFAGVLYSHLFSALVTFTLLVRYGYRTTGLNLLSPTGSTHGSQLLAFSFPLLVGSLMVMLLGWTDTLVLGRYVEARLVGVYHVSVTLATLSLLPLSALEYVFMPIAGELYGRRQYGELGRVYQILAKWSFAGTLPIFFLLFLFPGELIRVIFGHGFQDACLPLRILALGFLFHIFLGPNGILMVVVGKPREILNLSIAAAAFNISLNYVLIRVGGYGMVGASLATVITYVVLNVAVSILVFRKSRIHPLTAPSLRAAGSAFALVLIFLLAKHALEPSFWMVPVYVLVFIGTLVLSLFVTRSVDLEDRILLRTLMEKTGVDLNLIRGIAGRFRSG